MDILIAIDLINIWQRFESYGVYTEDFTTCQEIREVKLSSGFFYCSEEEEQMEMPKSHDPSFHSELCSIRSLRTIGKLQLRWTEVLCDHLLLDMKSMTLFIYWFGFQVESAPNFHIACQQYNYMNCHRGDNNPLAVQMADTYQLLFRSPKEDRTADVREYGQLPIPPWMRVFGGSREKGPLSTKSFPTMSYFLSKGGPFVSDMEYHLQQGRKEVPKMQFFTDFEKFEDRLRILVAHIQSQRPGGIRGLWRDRRDNYQWFTFWKVVVFGTFTAVMSFLGLGVAIAQAVAGFKALH